MRETRQVNRAAGSDVLVKGRRGNDLQVKMIKMQRPPGERREKRAGKGKL